MADTIGSMVARLSATADQFKADLQAAAGHAQHFVADVEGHAPKGGLMGTLLHGAGLGTGMELVHEGFELAKEAVHGFFEQFERAHELEAFAEKVHVSVEELTAFQFAAEQLGVHSESADMGLSKLQKAIGEAHSGSAETAEAFAKLGLNADDLAKESTIQALHEVADAISEMPNASDQAAAAIDIFGRSGSELLNVLRGGSEELEKLEQHARDVGAVMSNEQAASMAEAAKAMNELWAVVKQTGALLASTFVPVIKVVATVMREVSWAVSETVKGVKLLLGIGGEHEHKLAAPVKKAGESYTALKKQAEDAKKQAEELNKAHDKLFAHGAEVAKSLRTPWEIFSDTIADVNNLLNQGAINWNVYNRAVSKASDELEKATAAKDKLAKFEKTPGIGAAQVGTVEGFSALQSAFRQMDDAERQREVTAQAQLVEAKAQTKKQEEIARALTQGGTRILTGKI